MHSFPSFEPAHCSMSGFNCCFLTWIQIFQEMGKVVWYSHLLKNFLQFVVIHMVKDFSIINEAERDIFFWNSLAFSMIQQMLSIWSPVPLPFLNSAFTSGSSQFTYCWSLAWRISNIKWGYSRCGSICKAFWLPIQSGHSCWCCLPTP